MVDLGQTARTSAPEPLRANRMADGSELFPYLWRHFMSHAPVRAWLMRGEPYTAATVLPRDVSQGIAFCCNFTVPDMWADLAQSFDLGEMFIPDHPYRHFMCGSVVAATSYHKHLVCALGPAASRSPACLPSYRTNVRRMVIDMGVSRSINIMEFSWMQDGALIVTGKVLVPPHPSVPYQSAGCTGAFALFTDVVPGGDLPRLPCSLVSFVELPRCVFCSARGSPGCCCKGSLALRSTRDDDQFSSAVWPPRIAPDIESTPIDAYHNIRSRLDLIQHIAHVKITAHVVRTEEVPQPVGPPVRSYSLGPSRFVVKAVLFRPSTGFEADTLRQVADKLRLLQVGTLSFSAQLLKHKRAVVNQLAEADATVELEDCETFSIGMSAGAMSGSFPAVEFTRQRMHTGNAFSSVSSMVSSMCGACGAKVGAKNGGDAHICALHSKKVPMAEGGPSGSVSVNGIGSKLTETPSTSGLPVRRLQCPRCEKTFSQQGSLNRHLKNIHEDKKIPCQYCSMSFGQMFDLKRHQRRKHAEKHSPNLRRGSRTDTRQLRIATEHSVK